MDTIDSKIEDKEETKLEFNFPIYWDERDKYRTEEKELLKRINNTSDYYGNRIVITELGTVCEITRNNGFSEDSKELLFDEYIKDLEKRVLQEQAKVKYDKETNCFYLVDKDESSYVPRTRVHKIDINSESMKDYAFGKYDRVTSEIHKLYLKSMSIEERKELEKNKEEERNKIISKTNTSHELLTPTEARIYLDYLEEMERTNAKVINGKTKGIIATTAIPFALGFSVTGVLSAFLPATPEQFIECSLAMSLAGASVEDFVINIKGLTEKKSIFTGGHIVNYVKESRKTIKEKKEENKLIDVKASKLREIENVDRMVMAKSYSIEEFDKTLEDEKLESLNLKNTIMNNLDEVINRINLLNPEDKKELLLEAKEILNEYTDRYNKIINQDKNVIDMEADNYMNLKVDTLSKIAELEMKVTEVRTKDVELKRVEDESRLLTDKIDGFSELDSLDIDIQKIHEQSEKRVKVKSLKENKRYK